MPCLKAICCQYRPIIEYCHHWARLHLASIGSLVTGNKSGPISRHLFIGAGPVVVEPPLTAHFPSSISQTPSIGSRVSKESPNVCRACICRLGCCPQSILRTTTRADLHLPSCRPRPRPQNVRLTKPRAPPIARVESQPQVVKEVVVERLIRWHRSK